MSRLFLFLVSLAVHAIRAICRSRDDLVIENLTLQQQVAALKRERPRPALHDADRDFWVPLRAGWPRWANHLVVVQADIVAKWHGDRFDRYWARISHQQPGPGRPRVDIQVRRLIRHMALPEPLSAPGG